MDNIIVRPGIELVEIKGVYLLVADREARKQCRYIQRINDVGATIWNALKSGADLNKLCELIRKEYEMPDDYDLIADIISFIDNLKQYRYVIYGDVDTELKV